MDEFGAIRADLARRAPHSPAVAKAHVQLEGWIETLLTSGIQRTSHPAVVAEAFRASAKGTIVLGLGTRRHRAVITWAVERCLRTASG
jgi:hypothetical protein